MLSRWRWFDRVTSTAGGYHVLLSMTLLWGTFVIPGSGADSTHSLIQPGAQLQKLPGEYAFTEGPATDAEGNVFFTDQPNDRILRWDAVEGTVSEWLKPAGRSNGLWFDTEGNLIACADEKNQLWSISPDKKVTVLIENLDGKLLNGPNDVWQHPDGWVYFTDPLYVRDYWMRGKESQLEGEEVYVFSLPTRKAKNTSVPRLRRAAGDFRRPNGIVGSIDDRILYVSDLSGGKTYAFDIEANGELSGRRMFCELGSDGMTVDRDGNLYLTGRGVTVFNAKGEKREHIPVPEGWTANVTFGGKDRDLLFITASKGIYGLKMNVRGR